MPRPDSGNAISASSIFIANHRTVLAALVLAIGVAVLAMAARGVEHSAQSETARCERASRLQYVAWHREQTEAAEVASLTGFLHLFGSMADELAAQAGDDERVAGYSASPSCRSLERSGYNPRSR